MKKTKSMMKGVIAAALVTSLTACGGKDRPAPPTGYDCDDWEWDKDTGTYYCDDRNSYYGGSYYHGGAFYSNKQALRSSPSYKSYESSYKSGIGSGSKGGFGG